MDSGAISCTDGFWDKQSQMWIMGQLAAQKDSGPNSCEYGFWGN